MGTCCSQGQHRLNMGINTPDVDIQKLAVSVYRSQEDEQGEKYDTSTPIIEDYTLIWLDPQINDYEPYRQKLQSLFKTCIFQDNVVDYITLQNEIFQSPKRNKFFLILSTQFAHEIIKFIDDSFHIIFAFIFSQNEIINNNLINPTYHKIKIITSNFYKIYDSIISEYYILKASQLPNREFLLLYNNDNLLQYIQMEFLFKLIIKKGADQEQLARKELIEYAEQYFEEKNSRLSEITQFLEQMSLNDDLINFYQKFPELQKMVNQTIIRGNFKEIFSIRLIINYLYQIIENSQIKQNKSLKIYKTLSIKQSQIQLLKTHMYLPLLVKGFSYGTPNNFQLLNINEIKFEIEIVDQSSAPILLPKNGETQDEDLYIMQINSFLKVVQVIEGQNEITIQCQNYTNKDIEDQLKSINITQQQRLQQIIDQDYEFAHFNLCQGLQILGQAQVAKEILQQLNENLFMRFDLLGKLEYDLGNYKQSLEYLKIAQLNQFTKQTSILDQLGLTNLALGNIEQAESFLQQSLELILKNMPVDEILKAITYEYLGEFYNKCERANEALTYLTKALDIKRIKLGDRHIQISDTYSLLGHTYKILGQYEQAFKYQYLCAQIRVSELGEAHFLTAHPYNDMGDIFYCLGNSVQALNYQLYSLSLKKLYNEDNTLSLAQSFESIGRSFESLNNFMEAQTYYQDCWKYRTDKLGKNHKLTETAFQNLQRVSSTQQ